MKNMIISKSAQNEIEKRINGELYAECLYRHLSNCMKFIGFFGAAKFFLNESENEGYHYRKLAKFALDVGFLPNLMMILPFGKEVTSLKDAFQFAFDKEREFQKIYDQLYIKFDSEPTVQTRLKYFVHEQKKSVAEYADYLVQLDLCKNDPAALLQFDKDLV